MPLLVQQVRTPTARSDKRVVAAVCAVIVAVFVGVGVWSAADPGSYGRSGAGCVTVTFPSSTGGALLHECGARALALCRDAFRHDDRLALLTRPQCRAAGLH